MLQNRNERVVNYYYGKFSISAHGEIEFTRREQKDDSAQDISKPKIEAKPS